MHFECRSWCFVWHGSMWLTCSYELFLFKRESSFLDAISWSGQPPIRSTTTQLTLWGGTKDYCSEFDMTWVYVLALVTWLFIPLLKKLMKSSTNFHSLSKNKKPVFPATLPYCPMSMCYSPPGVERSRNVNLSSMRGDSPFLPRSSLTNVGRYH